MLRLRQGQEKEKFMSEAQAFWGPAEVGAGIFTKYQKAEWAKDKKQFWEENMCHNKAQKLCRCCG